MKNELINYFDRIEECVAQMRLDEAHRLLSAWEQLAACHWRMLAPEESALLTRKVMRLSVQISTALRG